MASLPAGFLEVSHRLPGRVRVRIPALRRRREEMERVARRAADLPGVFDVKGHPFTGSLLVGFDPMRIAEEHIVAALRDAAGVATVLQPGDPRPAPPPRPGAPASAVGRATMEAFRALDEEVMRVTGGGMNLSTLATLGFFGAGALGVAANKAVPAPPWFNLAWWGFRTFMTVEAPAVREQGASSVAAEPPDDDGSIGTDA